MARKRAGSKRGASVETENPHTVMPVPVATKLPDLPEMSTLQISRIPSSLRLPLLVTLSLSMSAFLYTLASPFTTGDLATVSAHHDQWWEVAGLLLFKVSELAAGWWEGYDTIDQSALTFLTHIPYLYFLTSLYKIRPTTAIACLSIDLASNCVPFYLLRSLLAPHRLKIPKGAVANRSVINDFGVQIFTSLFATGVYGVVVFVSFSTRMPTYLILNFKNMESLESIYNSPFLLLCAAFVPIGIAAKTFLFTPAVAARPDAHDEKTALFDAEEATLMETILYNVWGHSKRVKTLMERTAVLALLVGLRTALHTYIAVDGAEGFGAVAWSSVWVLAAVLTGLGFWWVGDVDGMSN